MDEERGHVQHQAFLVKERDPATSGPRSPDGGPVGPDAGELNHPATSDISWTPGGAVKLAVCP